MSPESVALLIASVVGSTGVASLLGSGIQISKAARIERAIERALQTAKLLDPTSSSFTAIQTSVTVMGLELAALRLVKVQARVWFLMGFMAVTFLSIIGMLAAASDASRGRIDTVLFFPFETPASSLLFLGIFSGAYIALLLLVFLLGQTRRRERFVAEALRHNRMDYALLSRYVSHLPETPAVSAPDLSLTRHPGMIQSKSDTKKPKPLSQFLSKLGGRKPL